MARAQCAAARGARRGHAVGDKPKGRGRALIKIEDRDSNLKKVRFGELYGLKSETSRVSGKGHIGNRLPHDIVDRIEADFDFRPTSWQPSERCLLTAGRITGTIRSFPLVCCVWIPLWQSPEGTFEPEQI